VYYFYYKIHFINGDWGLGIGDWGVGGWGATPTPTNPHPTPQTPKNIKKIINIKY